MKIIILGNGNLGTYMKRYFDFKKINNIQFTRKDIDASKLNLSFLLKNINRNDVVINCIGILKPKIIDTGIENTFKINSIFPNKVKQICDIKKAKFIHICSDCVFNGDKGNYSENDIPDANDIYGLSKSLVTNGTIIRTSFIGKYNGLLKWIIDNKDSSIDGYNNCIWNGVTALELAKCIEEIIINNLFWNGVRHLHSPAKITKYKLCKLISKIYNLNIKVKRTYADSIEGQKINKVLDRSLYSKYKIKMIGLEKQLYELREFDSK